MRSFVSIVALGLIAGCSSTDPVGETLPLPETPPMFEIAFLTCERHRIMLYFSDRDVSFSPLVDVGVDLVVERTERCAATRLLIDPYSDVDEPTDANLKLAADRAEAVRTALLELFGDRPVQIDITEYDQLNTPRMTGDVEPYNRRLDVYVPAGLGR